MEFHGIQKIAIVSMVYSIPMACQCNYMASRWNAVEFHGIQKIAIFYMVSMLFPCHIRHYQWNYMASRWNVVECHGIPWDTESF